jgi:hypothetical protein
MADLRRRTPPASSSGGVIRIASALVAIHHELTSGTSLFAWADELLTDAAGRVTRAHLYGHGSGTYATARYRTDGRADTWNVPRRTGASTYVDAMDREYAYSADGSSMGWATSSADDEDGTFLYDGANRLVCVTDEAASEACPEDEDPPLLEAFSYDASDSRTGYRDPSGTTTYTHDGVAMVEEDPPGSFVIDQHYELGDGGARIEDEDHTLAHTTREYFYDGLRRLRTVVMERPGTSPSDYDEVTITVHYDHRARPYLVTVTNEDTDVTEANRYYYDQDDQLLSWIRTPDLGTATTYDQRQYVRIGDFAVGEMARSWVSGSATRHTYLHTTEPMGLETSAYEFEHPGGASVSYNPSTVVRQWTAFGRPLVATGSGEPLPTRFPGQLALRGSEVRIWDGSVAIPHRDGLYLNRWRVYDPRVGEYLQPDPARIDDASSVEGSLTYGVAAPADVADPLGRDAIPILVPGEPSNTFWCRTHPWQCAAILAESTSQAAGRGVCPPRADTGTTSANPPRPPDDECRDKKNRCVFRCLRILPDGDLQSMNYFRCLSECLEEEGYYEQGCTHRTSRF